MLASEVMAKRALLHSRLVIIDAELNVALGRDPSTRNSAIARELLNNRSTVCDALLQVGYIPWGIPTEIEAREAASG